MDMSGEITKDPPPSRTIAAWKDDSVRSDGLRNSIASTLPSSARGSGFVCSRRASFSRASTSGMLKSARSLKSLSPMQVPCWFLLANI